MNVPTYPLGISRISRSSTGVYMAYPTTSVLKPIYRKLKTQVNDQHTKVGITTDSFATREREYRNTFQGEVVFVPLAEAPASRLNKIEALLLVELSAKYQRVGHAQEWFDTTDRDEISRIVLAVVSRVLSNGV
jgi:hypothetical protein